MEQVISPFILAFSTWKHGILAFLKRIDLNASKQPCLARGSGEKHLLELIRNEDSQAPTEVGGVKICILTRP